MCRYIEGMSPAHFIVARSEEEAYVKAHARYGDTAGASAGTTAAAGSSGPSRLMLRQEEDVLDTWFR